MAGVCAVGRSANVALRRALQPARLSAFHGSKRSGVRVAGACGRRHADRTLHAIADVCIVPLGAGASVGDQVTRCVKIIDDSGLAHKTHAYGTNIEGDLGDVLAAVKRCHETLHSDEGVPHVCMTIKLGTRVDKQTSIAVKIRRVEDGLKSA